MLNITCLPSSNTQVLQNKWTMHIWVSFLMDVVLLGKAKYTLGSSPPWTELPVLKVTRITQAGGPLDRRPGTPAAEAPPTARSRTA